jgi:hypothetical protein
MNSVAKPVIIVVVCIASCLWALPVKAEEVANLSGTWKLNVEKSDYGNMPKPKGTFTMKIEHTDPTLKWSRSGTDETGDFSSEFTTVIDGKQRPFTEGPVTQTQSFKRVSASVIEYVGKSTEGDTLGTGTWMISKDGKVLTQKANTRDMNAKQLTVTVVFEKQ